MGVVGEVADLVDAQELWLGVVGETAPPQFWGIDLQVVEDLGGGAEEDGEAVEDGLVGDVLGDHGLAQSVGAEQDEVVALADEIEGERALEGFAVDALGPVPVEIGHGLEATQAGALEATFEAAASAFLHLGLGDGLEQAAGGPAPLGGAGEQVVES